jgi:hypothetical protein
VLVGKDPEAISEKFGLHLDLVARRAPVRNRVSGELGRDVQMDRVRTREFALPPSISDVDQVELYDACWRSQP